MSNFRSNNRKKPQIFRSGVLPVALAAALVKIFQFHNTNIIRQIIKGELCFTEVILNWQLLCQIIALLQAVGMEHPAILHLKSLLMVSWICNRGSIDLNPAEVSGLYSLVIPCPLKPARVDTYLRGWGGLGTFPPHTLLKFTRLAQMTWKQDEAIFAAKQCDSFPFRCLLTGVGWQLSVHPLSCRNHMNLPSNLTACTPFLLTVNVILMIKFVLHWIHTKYYSGKEGGGKFNFMCLWKFSDILSLAWLKSI